MKNLGNMMKQAQEMQLRMQEMQNRLADEEVTGTSGGDLVTVTLNGKGEAKRVRIDPSLFNGDDVTVVEDLIVAAFSAAKSKVEARMADEMSKLTGGLNLPPGMTLPF
ncbi:MAG: YbaB/EbfC family nucleoid-associated protein [Alphaproteobacteria bacterium]